VKPEFLEEHLKLLAAVYAELAEHAPANFSWATFRLDDDSFVEIAIDPHLPGPLSSLGSFAAYRAGLEGRCSSREALGLQQVGAYRFPQPDTGPR
jgi:hypothetical protein